MNKCIQFEFEHKIGHKKIKNWKKRKKVKNTHLTISANFERSSKCAASTAETIAPSNADRSQNSSVTRNFLARLKKAAGPLDALTAITWCLSGVEAGSSVWERRSGSEDCS